MDISIETDRLILRPWQDSDLNSFFEMSQDTDVMRYFPHLLSRCESNDLANLIQSFIEKQGWGFWALELKKTKEFIGFTGLHHQLTKFEFSPCTEIGCRLKRTAWGKGYAYEAATASLAYGFNHLQLVEIVAFTAQLNLPSQNLMKRLGMNKMKEFVHPDLSEQSPLKPHVLYTISSTQFNVYHSP